MTDKIAKPFLKWAGGKTQLINNIEKALPKNISKDKFTYIEPFVGSGAILFWMLNNFPNLENFYLGFSPSGRVLHFKSSLHWGLSASFPHATYC